MFAFECEILWKDRTLSDVSKCHDRLKQTSRTKRWNLLLNKKKQVQTKEITDPWDGKHVSKQGAELLAI